MPDLVWNKSWWDRESNWQDAGEEWSVCWGGSESQWFGSLYPRIHRFLPARSIFEIAPGYGRWTRYLLQYLSGRYHGVDMSDICIASCESRFPPSEAIRFSLNDGLDLSMVEDGAFDFVFSFDSLVHADLDVHERYIPQILAKLTPAGAAFIHHSNWAAANATQPNKHCRGENVSADAYAEIVVRHGGRVIVQECLNWGTEALIDAFTIFGRADGGHSAPPVRIENPDFMAEAEILRKVHSVYCAVEIARPE